MSTSTFLGILFIGFVFGYLLHYSMKHTDKFSIELLSSAIGAVGGGTVIGLVGKVEGWLGPYGIGLGVGFLVYLILLIIFIAAGWSDKPTIKILGLPQESQKE